MPEVIYLSDMLYRPIQLDSYKSQEPHKLHYSDNLEDKLLQEKEWVSQQDFKNWCKRILTEWKIQDDTSQNGNTHFLLGQIFNWYKSKSISRTMEMEKKRYCVMNLGLNVNSCTP